MIPGTRYVMKMAIPMSRRGQRAGQRVSRGHGGHGVMSATHAEIVRIEIQEP